MEIIGFSTKVIQLPRPIGPLSGGPGANVSTFVTLKIQTNDGIEGISYAGFASNILSKALNETVGALTELTIGADPLMSEAIQQQLFLAGGSGAPAGLVTRAVSAIDVALWDIKGKTLGQPVWKLLGGHRQRVPTYASGYLWRTYDLNELAETAAQLVCDGFTSMKFRMGGEDSLTDELERMKIMRETVGPNIDIMLDINQGWNVNEAITAGRKLSEYDLFWLEDPIHHQDYSGLARIADAIDTPVASGEYHYGIVPFRHMLETRSIDIVMADLLRAGGLTGWMKIAHMAEGYNLPIVSHLATEVMAHAVAAAPNGLTIEHMPWTFEMFTEEPQIEAGQLVLSNAPGLGIEFDENAIDHYAIS